MLMSSCLQDNSWNKKLMMCLQGLGCCSLVSQLKVKAHLVKRSLQDGAAVIHNLCLHLTDHQECMKAPAKDKQGEAKQCRAKQ